MYQSSSEFPKNLSAVVSSQTGLVHRRAAMMIEFLTAEHKLESSNHWEDLFLVGKKR
jgi:hypothetical protein